MEFSRTMVNFTTKISFSDAFAGSDKSVGTCLDIFISSFSTQNIDNLFGFFIPITGPLSAIFNHFPSCNLRFLYIQDAGSILDPRAAAAVGQSELMSMYDAMFSQYNVKIAQVSSEK